MARLGTVAQRAEDLLGRAVVATTPVPGGDICTATRLRLSEGTSVLMKTRPHAPQDFFRVEADGLRWLAAGGGVAVPDVLAADSDCLILSWVDPSRPSPEAAEQFGRDLAVTHQAGAPVFGSESWTDGYIGTLPLRNAPADDWPDFYARRRVLPYLRLAVDRSERFRTYATDDADFDPIRGEPAFRELIG